MGLPRELSKLIPESNAIDLRLMSGTTKTTAIEEAYSHNGGGFTGCFLDGEDQPGWERRIALYCEDEFLHDTDGTKKYFSDVVDDLPNLEADGRHVYTQDAFDAFDRDAVHRTDEPYSVFQNFGICVDSSNKQQTTQLLGVRAMDSQYGEVLKYIAAHYSYAERGYCGHGWTMAACATVNRRNGWCPATQIEVDGRKLDWDEEDEHEYAVAQRPWCATGLPDWLMNWTRANFMYEDGAITRFDGGVDSLKVLLANKGVLHHGSNYTSASGVPDRVKRIGGHAQTLAGGDWSDEAIWWFRDKGVAFHDNNFPCVHHQTWGASWSGTVDSSYWPEHLWGQKPEGAWVMGSQNTMRYFVDGFAYLPMLAGIKSDTPVPPPEPTPEVTGELHGELHNEKIVIRGELTFDAKTYIATPIGGDLYRMVPKPEI